MPGSAFQPIGPSPFSGAQISVGVGAHTLNSPLPFGIYMYGFNSYDNYGYIGGACMAKGVSGSTLAAVHPDGLSTPRLGAETATPPPSRSASLGAFQRAVAGRNIDSAATPFPSDSVENDR